MSNGMKGSGLGLAIARSLAEMHGGSLRIRSAIGQGTVVLVHFPASRATPDWQVARPSPAKANTAAVLAAGRGPKAIQVASLN
jgi:hypothetical protein